MPGIGYHVPLCVAAKEIESIIIVELTDRETSDRSLKHSRYDLLAVSSVPMAFVDRTETDNGTTANASWNSFHCVTNSIRLRVFATGPVPEVERFVSLLILAMRGRVVCYPDVVDNVVKRLDRDDGTISENVFDKPANCI